MYNNCFFNFFFFFFNSGTYFQWPIVLYFVSLQEEEWKRAGEGFGGREGNLGEESVVGKGHAVSLPIAIISSDVKISIVCYQTVMRSLRVHNVTQQLDTHFIIWSND